MPSTGSTTSVTRTHAAAGLVEVAIDAAGDAAEQRGAERRALVRRHDLERQLERRSRRSASQSRLRDPPPETRPRAAVAPAPRTVSRQSRSANATPSSTARVSAPRPCLIDRPQNAPRASGSACGVRSPARYGRKTSPSQPGGHRSRPRRASRRSRRRGGACRGTRRATRLPTSITPITSHRSGAAWQKAWTRPSRVGEEADRWLRAPPRTCRARPRAGPVQ